MPGTWDDEWRDFTFLDAQGQRVVVRSTNEQAARRIAMRRTRGPVKLHK